MSKIASHIALLAQERNAGRAGVRLIVEDGVLVDDYDTVLRELFCVAANALAAKTRENLNGVGTLWDEIFVTGDSSRNAASRPRMMDGLRLVQTEQFSIKGWFSPQRADIRSRLPHVSRSRSRKQTRC